MRTLITLVQTHAIPPYLEDCIEVDGGILVLVQMHENTGSQQNDAQNPSYTSATAKVYMHRWSRVDARFPMARLICDRQR